MKLMKKFMKKSEGFTLVELIVVIAILAILAGVAVPVYSGYITKANEAADTQIVSAMNTAFAAACTENSVVPSDIDNVTVTVNNDKKVTAIAVDDADLDADVESAIASDFAFYFGSNSDTVLKYYGSFEFDGGNFTGVKAS